jgi:hypothetical protein
MRRFVAKVFGYSWTARLARGGLLAAALAALATFGLCAALGSRAAAPLDDPKAPNPVAIGVGATLASALALPLIAASARLLVRARGNAARSPGAIRIALRSAVPAALFGAAAALVFPLDRPPSIAFPVFLSVLGANVLFGAAEGARTTSAPSLERT